MNASAAPRHPIAAPPLVCRKCLVIAATNGGYALAAPLEPSRERERHKLPCRETNAAPSAIHEMEASLFCLRLAFVSHMASNDCCPDLAAQFIAEERCVLALAGQGFRFYLPTC